MNECSVVRYNTRLQGMYECAFGALLMCMGIILLILHSLRKQDVDSDCLTSKCGL